MLCFSKTKSYEVHVIFSHHKKKNKKKTTEAARDRLLTTFKVNDQLQILRLAFI